MGGENPRFDAPLPDLWDDERARSLDEPGLLLYRSNLLGSDLRITNFGGGNTSAKVDGDRSADGERRPTVLWVKGSGGDIGSMKLDGFATLYLDKLLGLKSRLSRPRARGRDGRAVRPLHLQPQPARDLDRHAAARLRAARACRPCSCRRGHRDCGERERRGADARDLSAASLASCPGSGRASTSASSSARWPKPIRRCGASCSAATACSPGARPSKACYQTTLEMINKAAGWLGENGRGEAFGGARVEALPRTERRDVAAKLLPAIRKLISAGERKVGHFTDAPAVLEFVNSRELKPLAALGTSCPDHFLRTKIRPARARLRSGSRNLDVVVGSLDGTLADYRADYAAYYERCKHPNSPAMRDPNPVIYLVPGVGMLSFAKDKATARIAAEFYRQRDQRDARRLGGQPLCRARRAGGLQHRILAARGSQAAAHAQAEVARRPSRARDRRRGRHRTGDRGRASWPRAPASCSPTSTRRASTATVGEFGKRFGKDVVARRSCRRDRRERDRRRVPRSRSRLWRRRHRRRQCWHRLRSARSRTPRLELWNRNMAILATGYFLVGARRLPDHEGSGARRQHRLHRLEERACRLAPAPRPIAPPRRPRFISRAASRSKARRYGIRVNTVNPDAVLRGSKIWQGEWRAQRAASNKVAEAELEEVYRQRSLLKRSVFPEDIAEAVYFFASDLSAKSTGNILNVDAGNAVSFTR